MCFPVKKDAEGWETVQRGRTARPRSATIAANVSPVSAHMTSKRDSTKVVGTQSHVLSQEERQLHTQYPLDNGSGETNSEQGVPVDSVPVDEVGDSENGDTMEVLWFSIL